MHFIQNLIVLVTLLLVGVGLGHCQFFNPTMDDKTYLDNIQKDVERELQEAQKEMAIQSKIMENVTRAYIAAKLRENVFQALRVIAENEMSKASYGNALRPPKSAKQESEDEDEEEATTKATTPLTGLGTAVKVNQQVFGFLNEAFKLIFQGSATKPKLKKAPTNIPTDAVDPAKLLMNEPPEIQILGTVSLLAQDMQAGKSPRKFGGSNDPERSPKSSSEQEDLEEEVNDTIEQGTRILNLFSLLGLGGKKSGDNKAVTASTSNNKKNETASGFEEKKPGESQSPLGNLVNFVENFRKSFNQLQASVPDIYRGVREAYKLLEIVRAVAERLEEFLVDAFVE